MEISINGLEYCTLSFNYNQEIIDFIKDKIPAPYRNYDNILHNWNIHQFFIPILEEFLKLKNIPYNINVDERIKPYYTNNESIFEYTHSKTSFYPHQKDAIKFEMTHKNFVIGDDQGLGKTLELLAFATSLKVKGAKHCLIICGVAGNVWNWQKEIREHTNEKCYILGQDFKGNTGSGKDKLECLFYPHDEFFYVTNKETLRLLHKKVGRKNIYPIVDAINQLVDYGQISLIAVDECHKLKNPETHEGRAFLKLKAPRKAMLSGTLVMNNPLDLYVPLSWCDVITQDFYNFKADFCRFDVFGNVTGYRNLDVLKNLLSPIYLRRVKEEVLNLPEKILIDEIIKLDAQQQKGYDLIENGLKDEINKVLHSDNPLSMATHLREYLDDPEIVELEQIPSPKYERLKELLDNIFDNNNSQIIIYSQWARVTRKIKEILEGIYHSVSYIDGDIKDTDRMQEIDKFQTGDAKIIIGTIGALGTGFTLNKATDVIFIDEPWNMAIKNQAIDRAHRIGTEYPVNVHTLICKDTIDERIHNLILQKGEMAEDLLTVDNPKLTAEEIKYLCGL